MFLRIRQRDENKWQVQIVRSERKGTQVLQKLVRNVGIAYSAKELEQFKSIGETAIIEFENAKKPVLGFEDPAIVHAPRKREKQLNELIDPDRVREIKRINEGFTDIFSGLFEETGLNTCISGSKNDAQWNAVVEAATIARIASPQSKLATLRYLDETFDIKIPFNKIYRVMDKLVNAEDVVKRRISRHTLGLFEQKVDVLFFDVTTLAFESIISDELRAFGFSKDCKFKEVQVTLALVTAKGGLPVTYKLFPGNTFEGHTLKAVIEEMKTEFKVDQFVFVADRAMFNEENLSYMEQSGIKYIVAAKLKSLPKDMKEQILGKHFRPTVVSNEFCWIDEFSHKSRRLIVSYSAKRAKKDLADRQRLLQRLCKKEKDGQIKVNDLIPNQGSKKFIKIIRGKTKIDEDKVFEAQKWDGLHGVITNQPEKTPEQIIEHYRGLWQIEEAFRINKHSLKMRPIFHWTEKRIKAHILICFMAFSLLKFALHKLKLAGENISPEELMHELHAVQASQIIHKPNKQKYIIPAFVKDTQARIYKAFGKVRDDKPYAISK